MQASPALRSLPAVIHRLRAAGCVFAEEEADLLVAAATTPDALADMVERRAAGVPLEHVVGWAVFHGLRVAVDPGVFVPRRRTEFLVDQAAALARTLAPAAAGRVAPAGGSGPDGHAAAGPRLVVVDLCCGSGALGAALSATLAFAPAGAGQGRAQVELHAADVDPAAVRCARRNLAAAGGRVHEGDLYGALPAGLRGRVHLIVANAPYVPTAEIGLLPAEARLHEARVALDGGTDGLAVVRRVCAGAPRWLAPGGHLLFETSGRQAPLAAGIVVGGGLIPRLARSDELDATVVIGTRPAAGG